MSKNKEVCLAYNFLKLSKIGVNEIEILNPDPLKPVSVRGSEGNISIDLSTNAYKTIKIKHGLKLYVTHHTNVKKKGKLGLKFRKSRRLYKCNDNSVKAFCYVSVLCVSKEQSFKSMQ